MPRLERIVIPGVPHHLVQWGNNGQRIFQTDAERQTYLAFLSEGARHAYLEVWAYCLMDTHVHLVATPVKVNSLAKGIGQAHSCYAQHVNASRGRRGHLWEGRYYSCALGPSHFRQAIIYVEQNPARAGVVKLPWQYRWSSAKDHVRKMGHSELLDLTWWRRRTKSAVWRERLRRRLADAEMAMIKKHTRRGWPLAGEHAMETFEKIVGRRVRPLPVGRPKGAGVR